MSDTQSMSDAEITRIHRRERALWRRYTSRVARVPALPRVGSHFSPRSRAAHSAAVDAVRVARREWMDAHAALEAARLKRAWRWYEEATTLRGAA